jgi:hypothetical protein
LLIPLESRERDQPEHRDFSRVAIHTAFMFNILHEVHMQVPIHRDSKPWQVQVWSSFLHRNRFMKKHLFAAVLSLGTLMAGTARAHSDASELSAMSALPLASVVAVGGPVAGASLAAPIFLSTAGAVFGISAVEIGAASTVYVLERASDGARISVEIAGRGAASASVVAGTTVTVSVIGAGIILSVAGEAIAFVPNALGRALLHNERLTY